jgi:predicted RNase H-like HicB family nuclease
MPRSFTLQCWIDDDWYVGRLKSVPGVFSQSWTLEDLEANIRDAYRTLNQSATDEAPEGSELQEVELKV